MKKNLYQKDVRDSNEFYNTEQWVTERLYEMIGKGASVKTILDPCCGACGLELFDRDYQYTLVDIDASKVPEGKGVIEANFLLDKIPQLEGKRFDIAVVNPPFSLTEMFVEKCFEYTDHVFLVSTLKTTFKKYGHLIADLYLDWRIPSTYQTLVSIGLFHLDKTNARTRMFRPVTQSNFKKRIQEKDSMKLNTVRCTEHPEWAKNLPFICMRITKARILKNEVLIKDADVHEAGDDSVFLAEKANINTPVGAHLERNLIYFDTFENAKKFQALYNDEKNALYLREYCYLYGDSILRLKDIPFLEGCEGVVTAK